MNKSVVITGSVLVLIAIILGAFGAHALEDKLTPEDLVSYETGVRYQMYHGLALVILGALADRLLSSPWVFRLMLLGVVLFSVSIYFLALQDVFGVSLKFLGPVTPLGGVLLIISWLIFIIHLARK